MTTNANLDSCVVTSHSDRVTYVSLDTALLHSNKGSVGVNTLLSVWRSCERVVSLIASSSGLGIMLVEVSIGTQGWSCVTQRWWLIFEMSAFGIRMIILQWGKSIGWDSFFSSTGQAPILFPPGNDPAVVLLWLVCGVRGMILFLSVQALRIHCFELHLPMILLAESFS